jgi:hypothetical protein
MLRQKEMFCRGRNLCLGMSNVLDNRATAFDYPLASGLTRRFDSSNCSHSE